ncbi:MAG: hypothetical protein LJE69_11980 [Thiohalocapsa sp.]|jgi:hypothetical protein|nr:hypothetical protein [Thiohalocapsa sp.]
MPPELMAKARRALASARLLQQVGDAAWALAQAESFVTAMERLLATDTARGSDTDSAEES